MKRKFLLIVAFCYFLWSLSVFVFAAKGDIIEGQVICDADIDLSNIKFDIDLVSVSGNLHPSTVVCTDEDGKFSFNHPGGDRYYCAINVDSLPFGYGVNRLGIYEKSAYYDENGVVFELARIDSIFASYIDGGSVSYSAHDKEDNVIYCKIEITRDECESFEDITYEELKLLARFPRTGEARAGGKIVKWSGFDAIGTDPPDMKMGMLYNEGSISKDKYYDLWLDYREDNFDGMIFGCGNPIRAKEDEVRNYANQTTDRELKERIISLLGESTESGLLVDQSDHSPETEIADTTTVSPETSSNNTSVPVSDIEAATGTNVISETEAVDNEEGTYSPLIFLIPCALLLALGIFLGVFVVKRNRE